MTYYLVGRRSTLKPDIQHSEYVCARNPSAAVRIAMRMLHFARRYSTHGHLWNEWYAAKGSSPDGRFFVYASGRVR